MHAAQDMCTLILVEHLDVIMCMVLGWQISAPVRSCGLSEDCRHLLAALGNGYIFRFEYRTQNSREERAAEPAAAD